MLGDMTIKDFLNKTASGNPVPGGGSAAALAGAVSASLCRMVAMLTAGKKKYEAHESEMKGIAEEARAYQKKFIQDMDRDSKAYSDVFAAFKLPKETAEEKEERTHAVQSALKHAAMVPLGVARDAFRVMELAGAVIGRGNRNAVTDGAVAAMMARTAVLSALYNVRINLVSIRDKDFAAEVLEEVERLENEIRAKEEEALSRIEIQCHVP